MDEISQPFARELARQVDELEAENALLRQQMEWQPIDTAPKDGSTILVSNGYRVVAVWWGDLKAADSEFGTVPHEAIWGWLITDGHNDPIWYRGHPQLKSWIPAPPPR